MTFFDLRTPRDMLEKARREHQRLRDRLDIDNVFNFMVTANHIRDYVQKSGQVPQSAFDALLQDQDILDCRDMCDKAKHMKLTKRSDPSTRVVSSYIGKGKVGQMMVGAGETWFLESEGRLVHIQRLAQNVMQKWEAFFAEHKM